MMRWLWSLVAGGQAPAGLTYRGEPAEEGAHVPYDLEPVTAAPKPPAVPAVALWETFQVNVVDAEDAFVGKVIRVVGTVERVEKRGEDYVLALARLRGTQRIVEVTFRKEDREELRGGGRGTRWWWRGGLGRVMAGGWCWQQHKSRWDWESPD